SDTRQITENLTKIRGPHTFKGGFEAQFLRFSFHNPRDPRGRMDFGSNYTGIPGGGGLGSGIATLLLTPIKSTVPNGIDFEGGPNSIFADSDVAPDNLRHYYGAYFQDDWKVTRKLTLNLGVRWEFFGHLRNKYGAQANFVPGAPGGGAAYVIASHGKNLPLSPAFTALLAKDGIALQYSDVPGLLNSPKANFAPRIGFAYQVLPKLVMRAAYGIFYAGFENLGGAPDPGTNYPFAVEPTISDSSGGTQTVQSQNPSAFPIGGFPTLERALTLVTPSATSPAFNPIGSSFEAFATPWKTGYTQEWNFELQYALTRNDSIQVGFVGNHSLHQINGSRINQPSVILPLGTVTRDYAPFPDFAQSRDYIAPNGDAYYYGLQATYQRRFSSGLSALANFTHSRCMEDFRNILNDDNPGGLQRALFLPGFGIKKDYTFCGDDTPNVFHLSGTWQVPFGKGLRFGHNANALVNGVLGGWSMNGILTAQNGFPGTVGCLSSTTADFGCVAFMVPGQSVYLHQGPHDGIDHFLNPAAFSQPPVATTIGQSDYTPLGGKAGQFHGPSFNNLDFSVFKSFPVRERARFEFRGEGYNILNHPNFGNNFTTLNFTNTNFSQINNTRGNGRQVQVALKLYW
ncbi:MAG: TonB-dependent receptor, partial [Acidobacteriota bacterium]|nr:TonB-dependent receptor [Acidobacteriota bacterium]